MVIAGRLLAAAAVLAAAPAFAADPGAWPAPSAPPAAPRAMGYAELSYGWLGGDADEFFFEDGLRTIGAAGVANIPFGGTWNVELEARGWSLYAPGENTLGSETGGFGHVYWRDPERWALGAVGGYSAFSFVGSNFNRTMLGAEALAFWNQFTFLAQAGYNWYDTDAGIDIEGLFARGAVRFFVTDNFRLQGDVQWTSFGSAYSDPADLALVGTAEYRFAAAPLSAFGAFRWDRVEEGANEFGVTTISLGIRGYLGSDSLRDNDRNGAPFDVLPALFSRRPI